MDHFTFNQSRGINQIMNPSYLDMVQGEKQVRPNKRKDPFKYDRAWQVWLAVSFNEHLYFKISYIRFRQQQPPGPIRKVIGRLLEHFRTSSSARHRQLFVFRTALDLLCSFARSKSADDGIYSRGSAHSALKECIRTPTRGGTSSSHLPYRTKAEDRRTTSTGASAWNFFNCGAFWPSVTLVDQPPSLFHN